MAAKFKYRASIDQSGKLAKIHGIRGFNEDLKLFAGKDIYIEISKYTKTRSDKQNKYYNGCVIPFVLEGLVEAGYERYKLNREVVHEFLKEKFLKEEIASSETGDVITITRSTSDISTTDFMNYIADIQRYAAEFLGIVIPDPNEQSSMNL